MIKLVYLAAMALLGLGLTMAQSGTPASDASNSSKPAQAQTGTASSSGTQDSGQHAGKAAGKRKQRADQPQNKIPDPTVQDQQSSTTSTTGAAGDNNSTAPSSSMGTTGSNPEPESTTPADGKGQQRNGNSKDQEPNSTRPMNPQPHLVMNSAPAARAAATHSPDPGTCMNPVALPSGASASHDPNCD
jgi:hypothetical protein